VTGSRDHATDTPPGRASVIAAMQHRLEALPHVLTFEQVCVQARALLNACLVPEAVFGELTENTVRYYRREGIVSPPNGHGRGTSWTRAHILQAAGARLAGSLRISTSETLPGLFASMSEMDLYAYVADLAARVLEHDAAVARTATLNSPVLGAAAAVPQVWPLASRRAGSASLLRASAFASPSSGAPPVPAPTLEVSYALPGGGRLTLPAQHWAVLRGGDDALEIVDAVRRALLPGASADSDR
jgi:hypothetical protein